LQDLSWLAKVCTTLPVHVWEALPEINSRAQKEIDNTKSRK
jgi:hypothetical protein